MRFEAKEEFAQNADQNDPLASFRERFYIPKLENGNKCLYLTGNSLGLQPKSTKLCIEQVLDKWAQLGVNGHTEGEFPWLPYHEFLTEKMASIVGGKASEVVVMNSLTVNLHLLMVSFYQPTNRRYKIMIEGGAFPSDQYAVKSQIDFHSCQFEENKDEALIELFPSEGSATLQTADIIDSIEEHSDSLALILLGGVNYYTGQAFDMEAITQAGKKYGVTVGFDLAHAAGNIPLSLHDWGVDFAAWCSYKYLNSGPGGIGGVFVHERHARKADLPRFAGWWGHNKETRFLMGDEFQPLNGAEGWQLSNPPIFQLASLRASLDIFEEAGIENLFEKSRKLTAFMEFLLNQLPTNRIEIITPVNTAERGCQLSIRVVDSDKLLFKKLTKAGVVADWREPDVIRVAPVPLYNSFLDVFHFVEILDKCL